MIEFKFGLNLIFIIFSLYLLLLLKKCISREVITVGVIPKVPFGAFETTHRCYKTDTLTLNY